MADPFAERQVTMTVTTKTGAYKVLVMESEAAEAMNAWYEYDATARSAVKVIEHSVGVLYVDLCKVEAINVITDSDAKRSFIERLNI